MGHVQNCHKKVAGMDGTCPVMQLGQFTAAHRTSSTGYGLQGDEIYSLLLDAKAAGHRLLSLSAAQLNFSVVPLRPQESCIELCWQLQVNQLDLTCEGERSDVKLSLLRLQRLLKP